MSSERNRGTWPVENDVAVMEERGGLCRHRLTSYKYKSTNIYKGKGEKKDPGNSTPPGKVTERGGGERGQCREPQSFRHTRNHIVCMRVQRGGGRKKGRKAKRPLAMSAEKGEKGEGIKNVKFFPVNQVLMEFQGREKEKPKTRRIVSPETGWRERKKKGSRQQHHLI